MSLPDPISATPQPLVTTPPDGHLAVSAEKFPGFALPEAVLHSIPLPAEFDELVRSAVQENQVKSILPKFFNPLFRRQGVVNKHALRALESVGQSLSHLAREIEGRDRVLEKLTAHLNAYEEHTHRSNLALANIAAQLARQVGDTTGSLQARIDQETQKAAETAGKLQARIDGESASSRLRTDTLVAASRSTSRQLEQLRSTVAEIKRTINEIQAATEQREILRREETSDLAEASQRTSDQLAETRQQIAALYTATQAAEARQRETQNLVIAIAPAVELTRQECETAFRALEQKTREQLAEQRETLCQEYAKRSHEGDQRVTARLDETEQKNTVAVAAFRDETGHRFSALESHLASAVSGLEERLVRIESKLQETATTTAEHRASAASRHEALVSSFRATCSRIDTLSSDIDRLRNDFFSLSEAAAIISRRQEATEASARAANTALDILQTSLRTQLEQLVGEESGSELRNLTVGAQETLDAAELAKTDGFYAALEARFRGPQALIRERQSKYLPEVENARKRVGLFPPILRNLTQAHPLTDFQVEDGVLDLGCGRGEWLDLLKERSVRSLGIDRNRFFLQSCRQRNIDVIDADIIDFLRNAPDESVAVVTSFHVIEHLPMPVFQEMAKHVLRILRRGGTAIFETPNPGNLLTSSLNFLLDPTHLRPVHPASAQFVFETTGFSSVRLEYLNPYDQSYHVGDPTDPLAQRFNEYIYGPQDYAVIGVKP